MKKESRGRVGVGVGVEVEWKYFKGTERAWPLAPSVHPNESHAPIRPAGTIWTGRRLADCLWRFRLGHFLCLSFAEGGHGKENGEGEGEKEKRGRGRPGCTKPNWYSGGVEMGARRGEKD